MDKILNSLETLYGGSGTPFFLSDEYGNIHWRNSACGTVIIFPKGINANAATSQVSVDGKLCSAHASRLSAGDKTLVLWRVNTLTDILMQLGSTDTYPDICYLLAIAKSDVEKARKLCTDKKALNGISRNIEVLSELSTVIYSRTPRAASVYFLEQLTQIAEEANKMLSCIPAVFKVDTENTFTQDVPVNAGQRMFYVCIFSIMKAMVRCADKYLFNFKVGRDADNVILSCAFSHNNETHAGMITDDFELYCARLYIEYIGGYLKYTPESDIATIRISIPVGSSVALNSPSFVLSDEACHEIADIFMSGIADEL